MVIVIAKPSPWQIYLVVVGKGKACFSLTAFVDAALIRSIRFRRQFGPNLRMTRIQGVIAIDINAKVRNM
jgi:hypothetical protein